MLPSFHRVLPSCSQTPGCTAASRFFSRAAPGFRRRPTVTFHARLPGCHFQDNLESLVNLPARPPTGRGTGRVGVGCVRRLAVTPQLANPQRNRKRAMESGHCIPNPHGTRQVAGEVDYVRQRRGRRYAPRDCDCRVGFAAGANRGSGGRPGRRVSVTPAYPTKASIGKGHAGSSYTVAVVVFWTVLCVSRANGNREEERFPRTGLGRGSPGYRGGHGAGNRPRGLGVCRCNGCHGGSGDTSNNLSISSGFKRGVSVPTYC